MAEWVRALAWAGDRTVSRPGSNPATVTSLRNFGNSVYPALPVSFGGDTKSRRSLLSGVYARGSKRSHQSALECVTVVDSTTHSKLPDLQSAIMRRKTLPCTCIGRRRRRCHDFGPDLMMIMMILILIFLNGLIKLMDNQTQRQSRPSIMPFPLGD